MKNLIKIISIVCVFVLALILLVGCSEKAQVNKIEGKPVEQTKIQIDWKSDTKGVKAAEVILKLEENMTLNEAEDIILSNSAVKDDEFIKGQYKFSDGSNIRVIKDEDTSSLDISISFPSSVKGLENEIVNFSNYKNIDVFGTYLDYANGFGTNGVLSSKYRLNSGEYMYNYYWIKDSENYAQANFYKSTGKMLSSQIIIDGEQRFWND